MNAAELSFLFVRTTIQDCSSRFMVMVESRPAKSLDANRQSMSRMQNLVLVGMATVSALAAAGLVVGAVTTPKTALVLCAAVFWLLAVSFIHVIRVKRSGGHGRSSRPVVRLIVLYLASGIVALIMSIQRGWAVADIAVALVFLTLIMWGYASAYSRQDKSK
jgi:phosphatidylserine synthase